MIPGVMAMELALANLEDSSPVFVPYFNDANVWLTNFVSGGSFGAAGLLGTASRIFPIIVPVARTFTKIGLVTTGTTAATLRLGLYAPHYSKGTRKGGPGLLIVDAGTIDLSLGSGIQELTISEALEPGMYFIYTSASGTVSNIRTLDGTAADVTSYDVRFSGTSVTRPWYLTRTGTGSGACAADLSIFTHTLGFATTQTVLIVGIR